MFMINVIITVLSILLVFFLFLKELYNFVLNLRMKESTKRAVDIKEILGGGARRTLVAVLFLTGIVLRAWQLGIVPAGTNADSLMTAIDARALLNHGTDHWGISYPLHMKAWGWGHQSPLLAYLLVLVFGIGGESDLTLVIPNYIISIIGIWALYQLAREVWGNRAALITLFIVTFNPWHFLQSRWALDCNLFPHIFTVALWLLLKGIRKVRYIYIAMVFFALCHYSYAVSLYIVPVFLLAFCSYLLYKKLVTIRSAIISAMIYIVLALPFYMCMISVVFRLPELKIFAATIPSMAESTRTSDVLFFSADPLRQLWNNLVSIFKTLALQVTDSLINTVPTYGNIYRFLFPFTLLGTYYLFLLIKNAGSEKAADNEKAVLRVVEKARYVGIVIYLTVAFMSGLITANVFTYRINIIYYGQMLLIALGILFLIKYSKRLYLGTIFTVFFMNIIFIGTYFTSYAKEWTDNGYSYHYKNALRYSAGMDCSAYYIVFDGANMSSALISEINTIYAHGLDALYTQGKSNFAKEGLRYRPYRQQYNYVKEEEMVNLEIDPDAVYIVRIEDGRLLSEELFVKSIFGQYCVWIPLEIYEENQK